MYDKIVKLWNQAGLVAELIQIRNTCSTPEQLVAAVNEWFVTQRITKEEKHLAFKGFYEAYSLFSTPPSMMEMVAMWHLCQMQDYQEELPLFQTRTGTTKPLQHLDLVSA